MNISDEAVEAATKAVIAALSAMELGWVDTDTPDGVTIDVRDFNLTAAISAALESAAPILLSATVAASGSLLVAKGADDEPTVT